MVLEPRVTEAELAILQVLWDAGASTIRAITDRLYPDGGSSKHATVQKLLDRLESKGCVARDRSSFAHVFQPLIERDDLVGQELREVATKLCEGTMTPLLLNLVRAEKLSPDDRQLLRRLLAEEGRS